MRVLLIEDDRALAAEVAVRAKTEGHILQIAAGLEDLFRIQDITSFDLVILDLGFTGLDPFLYLRKLKSLAKSAEILLLGVNPETEIKARNLGFGSRNFLFDPPNLAELFQRLALIARGPESATAPPPPELAAKQTRAAPAKPSRPPAAPRPAAAPESNQTPDNNQGLDTAPAAVESGPAFSKQAWKAGLGNRGRVLVVGSHKGGTGKSTTAMHLIAGLLYEGLRVASMDLDNPQQTLTRYIENRKVYKMSSGARLPMPRHQSMPFVDDRPDEVEQSVESLARTHDVLIIDTPGGYSQAARKALSWADNVVTPINDSFLDLDLLAVLDPETRDFLRPGHYAKLIVEARARRAQWNLNPIDWLVVRNRLSAIDARNKRQMNEALGTLSQQLRFRQGPGLSERVIFRELFLQGLTLLDLREKGVSQNMKMSHVAARQELRNLLAQLVPAEEAGGVEGNPSDRDLKALARHL